MNNPDFTFCLIISKHPEGRLKMLRKLITIRSILLFCLIAMVVIGCGGSSGGGGGDDDGGNDNEIDITGIWIMTNDLNEMLALNITQPNSRLTGSATWAVAENIPITGDINGDSFSLTIGAGVQFPISIVGTVDGDHINGFWNGSDPQGNPSNGTFSGEKNIEAQSDFTGDWSGTIKYFLDDGSSPSHNITLELTQIESSVSGTLTYSMESVSVSGAVINNICFLAGTVQCDGNTNNVSIVFSKTASTINVETAVGIFCDNDIIGMSGFLTL